MSDRHGKGHRFGALRRFVRKARTIYNPELFQRDAGSRHDTAEPDIEAIAGSPYARRRIPYRKQTLTLVGLADDHYLHRVGIGSAAEDFLEFIFAHAVPSGATVVDVGANIGVTAVMAATACGGSVFAFEPGPRVYPCLLETLKANPRLDITPINAGVGAQPGEMFFFDDPNTPAASHLVTGETYGRASSYPVQVVTLDQFVRDRGLTRLDLIKIDVEGFEIDVLRGAARTISTLRPSIFVEFNTFTMIAFRNINPREMLAFLRQTFPYLYRFVGGAPYLLDTDDRALSFLHDNIVREGCLDDLYGTFTAL